MIRARVPPLIVVGLVLTVGLANPWLTSGPRTTGTWVVNTFLLLLAVEFTRNAAGLERALASLAGDHDDLEAANRGTQHLWFRNPVKEGSDRRAGLLSTHPSMGARIDRLRALQGLAPLEAGGASASET